jgi:hypothetical protein
MWIFAVLSNNNAGGGKGGRKRERLREREREKWKLLKCPIIGKWLNKLWCLHLVEHYAVIKNYGFRVFIVGKCSTCWKEIKN